MWWLSVVVSCLLGLGCTAFALEGVSRNGIEQALAQNDNVLVAFVAPSGAKTRDLETEWQAAKHETEHPLLWVDCEAEAELCKEYGIDSLPTIQLFQDGKPGWIYPAARRASGFLNFIARSKRSAVTDLSKEDLEKFRLVDEVVFVGFFGPQDAEAREDFEYVASRYRDEFSFGAVSDAQIIEEQKMASATVVCYQPADGDTHTSPPITGTDMLEKFVIESARPVIGEMMPYNRDRFLARGWPMVYVFAETEAKRAELRQTLHKFARQQFEVLTSVTVDPYEFPDLQAQMGLEPGVFPAGAVHQLSKDRIYPYPKDLPVSSAALSKWGLDVYQGRIKPWTPPGVTTSYTDLGPTHVATRKVSIRNIPGLNIRVAGHDEL